MFLSPISHLLAVGAGVEAGLFIQLQLEPEGDRIPDAGRRDARRQRRCRGRHVGGGIVEIKAHDLDDRPQRCPLAPVLDNKTVAESHRHGKFG